MIEQLTLHQRQALQYVESKCLTSVCGSLGSDAQN
jgi:hypothetical protein